MGSADWDAFSVSTQRLERQEPHNAEPLSGRSRRFRGGKKKKSGGLVADRTIGALFFILGSYSAKIIKSLNERV